MDTRVVRITEGFYNSKGIHIVTGGIYIDGSFNVGFSLFGVFPLSTYFTSIGCPYEFTLGGVLGGLITLPVGEGYQTGRLPFYQKRFSCLRE